MLAGINMWQLLIVFVIILLLFGRNKLRSVGSDLGCALKAFKKEMNSDKD